MLVIFAQSPWGTPCMDAPVFDDEYGRASGRITVGGFAAASLEYVEGILLGDTDVLARNTASLSAPPLALARWAEEQADVIARSEIPPEEQIIAAGVVIACGGDPGQLPIAHLGRATLTSGIWES